MSLQIKTSLLALAISMSILPSVSYADDIDILDPQVLTDANILFVMDLSGSMNAQIAGGTETRLEVLRGAFKDILADPTFEEVNFGLSVFSGDTQRVGRDVAHGIAYPVSPVSGETAQDILNSNNLFAHPSNSYLPPTGNNNTREYLSLLSNDWDAGGGTALAGALFEAALYFRGEEVSRQGRFSPADIRSAHPSSYVGNITSDTSGSGIYKSPITDSCTVNGVILLTDGAPSRNTIVTEMADLIGPNISNNCDTDLTTPLGARCVAELAEFMFTEDQSPLALDQPVQTYPVGLALNLNRPGDVIIRDFLNEVSIAGNGSPAIIADNREELTAAFTAAISGVVGRARSFSAPSFSVDTSTLLTNGPFVYVPVFDRSTTLWPGNLKKYKLVNGVLTDADNNPALDATNGILDTARDFWSADASTNSVTSGGIANRIDPSTRKILTDNGGALIALTNNIPNAEFGLSASVADTNFKNNLVTFISGEDPITNTVRNHVGDILHSVPVQLNFSNGRRIVFVGTNEGYLHAINDYENVADARNGTEAFAYMPNELLDNIKDQFSAVPLPNHKYGADGVITLMLDESANNNPLEVGNGVLDVANGERAFLFFGLRRGGTSYSALEVTNPDNPRLLWSNSFGTGDSWSQPVATSLKWAPNTTAQPVIIIGGGFNDDDNNIETAGGNQVFVIDAMTGNEVWSTNTAFNQGNVTNFAGATLPNAVPSRIRAVDLDRNNSVDRLYFGDTGGNLWRVDLNAANFDTNPANDNDINEATLYRIAALGGTGVDNRQFFEEPDVSIFRRRGALVTSIAIGSGNRPTPLSTAVEDRFFVIYDDAVSTLPSDPLITLASGNLKTVPVSEQDTLDPNFRGWQLPLNSATGEKILSPGLTFQGRVLFTSFASLNVGADICAPANTNVNTLYVVDIFSGTADAVVIGGGGEIFSTPKIVYPDSGTCVIGDCQRVPQIAFGKEVIDFPAPLDINGNPIVDFLGNPVTPGGNPLERVYWIDSDDLVQ